MRVYCGLASAGQRIPVAIVDHAGRLLVSHEVDDSPTGYAAVCGLIADRCTETGSVRTALATDSETGLVPMLLGASGEPLAIGDESTATRFGSEAPAGAPEPLRRAFGLARALQAGTLTAAARPAPRDLAALRPVLAAHRSALAGRSASVAMLRDLLRELYPAALRTFPDPGNPLALAVLELLADPGQAARGQDGDVVSQLRSAGFADADRAVAALRQAVTETSTGSSPEAVAAAVRGGVAAVRASDATANRLADVIAEHVEPRTGGGGFPAVPPASAPPASAPPASAAPASAPPASAPPAAPPSAMPPAATPPNRGRESVPAPPAAPAGPATGTAPAARHQEPVSWPPEPDQGAGSAATGAQPTVTGQQPTLPGPQPTQPGPQPAMAPPVPLQARSGGNEPMTGSPYSGPPTGAHPRAEPGPGIPPGAPLATPPAEPPAEPPAVPPVAPPAQPNHRAASPAPPRTGRTTDVPDRGAVRTPGGGASAPYGSLRGGNPPVSAVSGHHGSAVPDQTDEELSLLTPEELPHEAEAQAEPTTASEPGGGRLGALIEFPRAARRQAPHPHPNSYGEQTRRDTEDEPTEEYRPPSPRRQPPAQQPAPSPPLTDNDGDLLIFAQARSAWFSQDEPDGEAPEWRTEADAGWSAAEAASQPTVGGTTGSGLPRRVPSANLVPGTAPNRDRAHVHPVNRDAAQLAAHTAGYFRGWNRARQDAQEPPYPPARHQ